MQRLKRKIEELRQQPEHVRLRVASLLTVSGGAVIAVLWLVVLLPLQLKLTRGDTNQEFPEESLFRQAAENPPVFNTNNQPPVPGQVGGVQDTAPAPSPLFKLVPSPSVGALPIATSAAAPTPFILATPSPSPSLTPSLPSEATY